ncbi:MAG: AEC family transporter [Desulfarculaceae bacterium]|nr:AEC family transporter [Desulfarculaceae bacterium]MCF8071947.1 AEC family transporter [Desulfarculaceae bacterium]MCF8101464.1 AEC family transporter [Desulfarculaceae bacterium]MCF8115014.1 AEC family transporter [Desulfarculaceae bacterium]
MDLQARAVVSIAVLVGIIILAMLLRRWGVVQREHGKLFASLVTDVTLPALIFTSLSGQRLSWGEAALAGSMLAAEMLCLALAWVVARAWRLSPPRQGAFMLTAAFGSSALLGYALINQVFPGDAAALAEAVLISEVGVGPALFTVGVMVAIYYGQAAVSGRERLSAALGYFRSPIFWAMAAGLICSGLPIPWDNPVLGAITQALQVLGRANTFLVALVVGVVLEFKDYRAILGLAAAVCVFKLILKPVLVWLPSLALSLPAWQVQVLVLEGAMPSALLTVALSAKYGCDAGLASRLVFATTVAGAATILVMFRLLG